MPRSYIAQVERLSEADAKAALIREAELRGDLDTALRDLIEAMTVDEPGALVEPLNRAQRLLG